MKAAIFHQVGTPLFIEEVSDPVLCPDEILLKVNKEVLIQFSLGCRNEDFKEVVDLLKGQTIQPLVGFNDFSQEFEDLRRPIS